MLDIYMYPHRHTHNEVSLSNNKKWNLCDSMNEPNDKLEKEKTNTVCFHIFINKNNANVQQQQQQQQP